MTDPFDAFIAALRAQVQRLYDQWKGALDVYHAIRNVGGEDAHALMHRYHDVELLNVRLQTLQDVLSAAEFATATATATAPTPTRAK